MASPIDRAAKADVVQEPGRRRRVESNGGGGGGGGGNGDQAKASLASA
jgi:hypothetical protein